MKQSNSIPIQVEQYLKKADEKLESARFLFRVNFMMMRFHEFIMPSFMQSLQRSDFLK